MALIKKFVKIRIDRFALNTEEAARFIGVSEALLRKMRSQGNGPNYAMLNSKIVYPVTELKSFLEKNLIIGGAK